MKPGQVLSLSTVIVVALVGVGLLIASLCIQTYSRAKVSDDISTQSTELEVSLKEYVDEQVNNTFHTATGVVDTFGVSLTMGSGPISNVSYWATSSNGVVTIQIESIEYSLAAEGTDEETANKCILAMWLADMFDSSEYDLYWKPRWTPFAYLLEMNTFATSLNDNITRTVNVQIGRNGVNFLGGPWASSEYGISIYFMPSDISGLDPVEVSIKSLTFIYHV